MNARPLWFPVIVASTVGALAGCVGTNQTPTAEPEAVAEDDTRDAREFVVVEWAGTTSLYVGHVVERREGLVGVQYPDGSREWAEPERVRPLALNDGDTVRIRWREAGPEWDGRVTGLRSDLVQVHFERGSVTWVSLDMVARVESPTEAPSSLATATDTTPPSVDPSRLVAGLFGVALYEAQTPYTMEIVEVGSTRVNVRWLTDGTHSWVPLGHVTTVFDRAPTQLTPGLRVRYVGASGVGTGTIIEVRGDFVRIGATPASRGEWVERREVVEDLDAVPTAPSNPTTQATVSPEPPRLSSLAMSNQ